jgi:periplasmic protein TonB
MRLAVLAKARPFGDPLPPLKGVQFVVRNITFRNLTPSQQARFLETLAKKWPRGKVMTLAELLAANPGIEWERLRPGTAVWVWERAPEEVAAELAAAEAKRIADAETARAAQAKANAEAEQKREMLAREKIEAAAAKKKQAAAVAASGTFKGAKLYELSTLDQAPQARTKPAPQFSLEMRKAGVRRQVVVNFIVDSNGEVQNAYALSSTRSELEEAAVQAISKWKFRPGRKGGRDVPVRLQETVPFPPSDAGKGYRIDPR